MPSKVSSFITILLLLFVVFVAVLFSQWRAEKIADKNSDATRTLGSGLVSQFTNLDGTPFSFADFDDRVRVVHSWATWSPFSKDDLPDLAALAALYDEKEVVVIAINRSEDSALVQAYIEMLGELAGIHFALDPEDVFYDSIGGFAMPETVIYDANGAITYHKRGTMTFKELQDHVEQARSVVE